MGLILLPGTCSRCGCTDAEACPDGCSWVDAEHTLCSACAEGDDTDDFDERDPMLEWDTGHDGGSR